MRTRLNRHAINRELNIKGNVLRDQNEFKDTPLRNTPLRNLSDKTQIACKDNVNDINVLA